MDQDALRELGAKPSLSEEIGLSLLRPTDKLIFSPGISTAGFAEVRMALANPDRKIIATTIDKEGLVFTKSLIARLGLESQIDARFEDLLAPWNYSSDTFDFIFQSINGEFFDFDSIPSFL